MRKILLTIIFLWVFVHIPGTPVYAQETTSSGIATVVEMTEPNIQEGDIIVFTSKGYTRSSTPYDPTVFGIITNNPAVTLEEMDKSTSKAILTSGKVYIRVSSKNGVIHKGDLVTTSSTPGVGQKATESGYVVGTAIEDYTISDPNTTGKILVALHIAYNSSSITGRENLIKNFRQALEAPVLTPLSALRYSIAGIIIVACTLLSLIYFGRATIKGVEAIGRNPIAEKSITLSVVLHLIMSLATMAVGLIIGYVVLLL